MLLSLALLILCAVLYAPLDGMNEKAPTDPTMTIDDVRDALDSVSKHNFGSGGSNEWSAVFDLATGEAHYYHREDHDTRYTFHLNIA